MPGEAKMSSDGTKPVWKKTTMKTQNKMGKLSQKVCGITRGSHELEKKAMEE